MRTTIDKAGRMVIPRPLRERVGLTEGGEVDVEVDGAGIRVEAVPGDELEAQGDLLFIPATGMPVDAATVRGLIDAERHGR